MSVSVETLKGLERKMTVSVPSEKLEEEVNNRLKDLARKVKVDGFRPGKVPFHVVKNRYSDSVRQEVARDMVQSSLLEAIKEKELNPAGYPHIEPQTLEQGKDFVYTASFEVFPQFEVNELNQETVEIVHAQVNDADVKAMLEKLREQNKEWEESTKATVAKDHKITMDFVGFLDGKEFEGGKAEGYELVIGSGSMIPGFEDSLLGAKKGKEIEINVEFPKDYGHQELAGKPAMFKVTVTKIMEGRLPDLDDAFAQKYNIKEGGIEALTNDIKQNMERELERRISTQNREKSFDKLIEKNKFDLPMVMINQEIEHLKHEMYHRVFGHEHHDNEKIPDFPRELFEEQAKRRVHLGLLIAEYVKKHEMVVDKARVDAMIDKLANAYEDPNELRNWYKASQERMGEIEAIVMEEMVSEKILEDAKIKKVASSYEDVMNPKQTGKAKGEKE